MADDWLDGGSSNLPADGGGDAAHLAADPDTELVRVAVAATILVDVDATGLDAGQRLQPGDHRPERVTVVNHVSPAAQTMADLLAFPESARVGTRWGTENGLAMLAYIISIAVLLPHCPTWFSARREAHRLPK
jgi:hypothetical protein